MKEHEKAANDHSKKLTKIEEPLYHVSNFLHAIDSNSVQFEKLLEFIVQSPYQNENGDLWVTETSATNILKDLYQMAVGRTLTNQHNYDFDSDEKQNEILIKIL